MLASATRFPVGFAALDGCPHDEHDPPKRRECSNARVSGEEIWGHSAAEIIIVSPVETLNTHSTLSAKPCRSVNAHANTRLSLICYFRLLCVSAARIPQGCREFVQMSRSSVWNLSGFATREGVNRLLHMTDAAALGVALLRADKM
jgi:hypothetical protein